MPQHMQKKLEKKLSDSSAKRINEANPASVKALVDVFLIAKGIIHY
jgi:hypothetical protein